MANISHTGEVAYLSYSWDIAHYCVQLDMHTIVYL